MKTMMAACLGLAALAGQAQAATVSFSQTQELTANGQNLTYTFGGLSASDGGAGTLTIATGGNRTGNPALNGLDLDANNEFFDLSIEGVAFGRYNCSGGGNRILIPNNTGGIDCRFALTLTLGAAQLTGFLADGTLSVLIDFSNSVDHFGERDQVIVSGAYQGALTPVPLPASALLLLAGLGALGWRARR